MFIYKDIPGSSISPSKKTVPLFIRFSLKKENPKKGIRVVRRILNRNLARSSRRWSHSKLGR